MAREGFIGMEEFRANLERLHEHISGDVLVEGLLAGAEVFRSAIASATPVRTGTARSNVIIYQRQAKGLMREKSFLVGHSKREAYYTYFLEYGTWKMRARPFMRPAFDMAAQAAMDAAAEAIKARL